MNRRSWGLSVLIGGALLCGCHQGEEADALERESQRAEMIVAELQDLAANLPERRKEVDVLSLLHEQVCPSVRDEETAGSLEKRLAPLPVRSDGPSRFTLAGSGGIAELRTTLERLAEQARFLSIRELTVSGASWNAELEVALRCRPIPPPSFTQLQLPPKTDWLRDRPDRLREELTQEQLRIHELEQVLWSEPRVLRIHSLKRDLEWELRETECWDLIRGQQELLTPLLSDSAPGHLLARFDRERVQLASDVPLTPGPEAIGLRWDLQVGGKCDARWCATAVPSEAALQERRLYSDRGVNQRAAASEPQPASRSGQ